MSETKTDQVALVREQMAEFEDKRGLVAAELEACELELMRMRGELPSSFAAPPNRGMLALDAILGDGGAAGELEASEARERYLERRAGLCREAIAHADEVVRGLRRTWLQGPHLTSMDLEEIPEVVRERVRATREREREGGR